MGLIRKTLSISTLGLVSWRSKKEQLREANETLDLTRADLQQATEKHALARERLTEAERRAEQAELGALKDSRRARWAGRRDVTSRVGLGRVALATIKDAVAPVVESANETRHRLAAEVEPAVEDAVSKAKNRGARARKRAEKASDAIRNKANDLR